MSSKYMSYITYYPMSVASTQSSTVHETMTVHERVSSYGKRFTRVSKPSLGFEFPFDCGSN